MSTDKNLIKVVETIAQVFKVMFSAARAFVILKTALFSVAVATISAGLYFRGSANARGTAEFANFELLLSEPTTLQVIAVVIVFGFTLVANLYCLNKNREHEARLRELEVKAPPSLRKKLRPKKKRR